MGSTEIVVSSVRPSVCPSVRPSVSYFSAAIAPRELKYQHKSVALQWSIVRSGIWGPWPRSLGIWPWPGPLPKKYTFTSITRVPVAQIEQMRGNLKGLRARIVMSSESMVTCASGLLPNPAKVPYSNIGHDGTLSFRNFITKVKKFKIHNLEPTAMIRPKSQNYKTGYDGILSIGNFLLVIKNQILLFQLPGNWPTTK
jgi:hypothetical protein